MVSSACVGLQRRGVAEPTPTNSSAYGGALDLEEDALKIEEPGKGGGGVGTLLVQLIDTTNKPIAGAVLRYRGPSKGTKVTDRDGIATFKLEPGSYTVDVVKCGRAVVVDDVAEATATIVAGKSRQGRLTVDAGQVSRRYQPTNSATASENAPWSPGDAITLGVRFDDTCKFERAPDIAVGEYRWRAGGSLKVTGTPKRTDAEGFARVTVTCARAGDASLEIYHPADPGGAVNVLQSLPNPAFGAWCG